MFSRRIVAASPMMGIVMVMTWLMGEALVPSFAYAYKCKVS
jgi:hypothetical protein